MKVSDTAGQMVACSVAFGIFTGCATAADISIKFHILKLVLYECTGTQYYSPLYPFVSASLLKYPLSFFKSKANCTAILEAYKNYYAAFKAITLEHLNLNTDPHV